MSKDYQKLFTKLRNQVTEINENRSSGGSYGNEFLLKLKPGNNYVLRLLWLPTIDGCDREYPMINQYVHEVYNPNATDHKFDRVCCPTSQYILGESKNGFDSCPICRETSRLYREYDKNKSQSAYDMWKTFRRKAMGYVPVYVVNGPADCVGQIRILNYGKQMKEFFDFKIFGIMPKKNAKNEEVGQDVDPDEIIGLDAFMYLKDDEVVTSGYNFTVNVTTKAMPINGKSVDMPQYRMDFTRKMTDILKFDEQDITVDYFNTINKTIRFDSSYYIKSTDAERQEFFTRHLAATSNDLDTTSANNDEDDMPVMDIAESEPIISKPVKTAKAVIPSAPVDDDIDVDALIEGL